MVSAVVDILFSGVNTCLDWGVKIAFIFLYFVTDLENTNPSQPSQPIREERNIGEDC